MTIYKMLTKKYSPILVLYLLFTILFQAEASGLTGHIEFNEGKRSNFKLDLLKLKKEELRKVGHWTPSEGINITDPTAFYETTVTNITLVVMTREVTMIILI